MPAVATLARTAPKAAPASASSPSRTAALRRLSLRTGGGAPLPPTVRLRVESALGTSLGDVRVHAGAEGGSLVDAAGARAITYGRDIFLGSRERADDVSLLAHEAAHVVQQRRAPVPQAAGVGGGAFEAEADRAAVAVAQGRTASVSLSTGGPVAQAETGDGPVEAVAYGLLERFAPQLVPIVRRGPLGWLREQVEGAVDRVFETVTAPVRVFANVGATLAGAFGRLMAWMGEAAGRIARNDCRPITEAAERLQQVFEQVTGPAIERLRAMADGVRGFFTGCGTASARRYGTSCAMRPAPRGSASRHSARRCGIAPRRCAKASGSRGRGSSVSSASTAARAARASSAGCGARRAKSGTSTCGRSSNATVVH